MRTTRKEFRADPGRWLTESDREPVEVCDGDVVVMTVGLGRAPLEPEWEALYDALGLTEDRTPEYAAEVCRALVIIARRAGYAL
jgi:hypothetical protein